MTLCVVIPVYNVQQYLRRCIDSVLSQLRAPDEIILIDDGSTDESGRICDEYAQSCPQIRVIHQANCGLSAARNIGIEQASSEWITFVDSDDYIERDMYRDMLRLVTEDVDIVSSGLRVETDGESYSRFRSGDSKPMLWFREEAMVQLLSLEYIDMAAYNKLYRRSLFEDIRYPVGKICEDIVTTCRLYGKCRRAAHTTRAYYHYVQRSGSITRGQSEGEVQRYLSAWRHAADEQLEIYQREFPQIAFAAQMSRAFTEIGCCNYHWRMGREPGREELQKARRMVAGYSMSIMRVRTLSPVKKAQAALFCACPAVYRAVIRRFEHR